MFYKCSYPSLLSSAQFAWPTVSQAPYTFLYFSAEKVVTGLQRRNCALLAQFLRCRPVDLVIYTPVAGRFTATGLQRRKRPQAHFLRCSPMILQSLDYNEENA
jgi:hypothetical protein